VLCICPRRRPQAIETYASEYRFVHFSSQTAVEQIAVTEDLEEDASDAMEKGAEMLYLELRDIKAVRTVLECQSALKLPLWVRCPTGSSGRNSCVCITASRR
jgi:hypothetical protein